MSVLCSLKSENVYAIILYANIIILYANIFLLLLAKKRSHQEARLHKVFRKEQKSWINSQPGDSSIYK